MSDSEDVSSSSVPLKKHKSKDLPENISSEPTTSEPRRRPESPVSSCVSLKSDESRNLPPTFSNSPPPSVTEQRPVSPVSSCVSLKSDESRNLPPTFSNSPPPSVTEQRPVSSVSSCVSLKSNESRNLPPTFSKSPPPSVTGSPVSDKGHYSSSVSCLESLKSKAVTTAQNKHKQSLQRRCGSVTEGTERGESTTALNKIYTELYIIEDHSEEVCAQHEVTRMEANLQKTSKETRIQCNNIFKPLATDQKTIRVVLTSGVAGVGKTFSVLKFSLDWAQGLENQEVDLVVPLSLRELNLVREKDYSLLTLIHDFHPVLQELTAETLADRKLLFIFDGLDESRLPLDFNCEVISEVTQRSQVNVLLVNLIRGTLFPSALIWITSRPAAANQIPARYVDRFTEVRGFTEAQKEEYFKKRFTDEELFVRVLSNIKTSRSLHIMCQIPVFCWITATVLEHMLGTEQRGPLPQTLTEMYAHFLLVQTHRKRLKYQHSTHLQLTQADCEVLLKLGRLAFEQLQKGNIMFYQEDLQQVGLDLTEASVYSGLCTEIFKQETVIFHKSVYCFVHVSVQEFLAAVYFHHCFRNSNTDELRKFLKDWDPSSTLDVLLEKATEKGLKSQSGLLDLFVRFIHGLLVESNQRLLKELLVEAQTKSLTIQNIIKNLKQKNKGHISANGSITIYHSLMEMNDHSVHQDVLDFLKSEFSSEELSKFKCSVMAQKLQMSGRVLDELVEKTFKSTPEGKVKLKPHDISGEAARLWCGLSEAHSTFVASALESSSSNLRELDLWLHGDAAVKALSNGLRSPNCKLELLSLQYSRLSETSCDFLASALLSNPIHLRKLDVSWNEELKDSGVKQLCHFLQSPDCQLENLRLESCSLSMSSCSSLASALTSNPFYLKELDLTENDLTDSGVEHLCVFLRQPGYRLEHLRLDHCGLSESSCLSLASALKSSNLKKLDLSVNDIKDSGVMHLCDLLQSPDYCRLETIVLKICKITEVGCSSLASALESNPSHLKDLRLNWNKELKDSGVKCFSRYLQSPHCKLEVLRFRGCNLSGRSCAFLASSLESNPSSRLRELDLCENSLKESDMEGLTKLLQSPDSPLEKLESVDAYSFWFVPLLRSVSENVSFLVLQME